MNFTITINGEGAELGSALRAVKNALEGQTLAGEVSTTIVAPQQQQAPIQQPIQQQAFQQLQPQYDQQQAPVYQQQAPVQQQAQQVYQQQPVQNIGVPLSTVTYDMAQLSVAATQLMDAGRQPELMQLLAQFGVQALTQLPKEHYGAFATQLRAMGAKI